MLGITLYLHSSLEASTFLLILVYKLAFFYKIRFPTHFSPPGHLQRVHIPLPQGPLLRDGLPGRQGLRHQPPDGRRQGQALRRAFGGGARAAAGGVAARRDALRPGTGGGGKVRGGVRQGAGPAPGEPAGPGGAGQGAEPAAVGGAEEQPSATGEC